MGTIYNIIERKRELGEPGMDLPEGSTNSIFLYICIEVILVITNLYVTQQK
jgi:hypothetical protein